MARPKKPAPERVVRRPKSERKRLSPELEALARGETDRLVRPRRIDPDRVRDPREGYAIKGVANRDARAVYDARLARLHAWLSPGEGEREAAPARLGEELCDWARLQLWRARRVTHFRALCEDILGQPEAGLRELAEQASRRHGVSLHPLSERTVALWLRLEAGLLEADRTATVRLGESGRFEVSVALDPAAAAVAAASVRLSPLAREHRPSRSARDGAGADRQVGGGQDKPRRRPGPKPGGPPRRAAQGGGGFGVRRPRKGDR